MNAFVHLMHYSIGKGAVKNKFYFVYQFPRDFVSKRAVAGTAKSAAGAIHDNRMFTERAFYCIANGGERPGEGHCGIDYKHIYQLC